MLVIQPVTPRQFINPLLSKRSIVTDELDTFENALKDYLNELQIQLATKQTEPNIVSNALQPFFLRLGYSAKSYSQKGQSGIDLALMLEHEPSVIIEAKTYGSSAMITHEDINKKALHEAIYYFMVERDKGNVNLFHIIITDFYNWYIFDAKDFERLFWQDKSIRKLYESIKDPSVLGDRTSDFYELIKKKIPELKSKTDLFEDASISCAYFNFKNNFTDKQKIAVYKLLSKDTLFKQFNPNDANSLNRTFYNELLYILGLEEYKEKGKKLIGRSRNPQRGALYENISRKLSQYGRHTDFESIIQLMIVWINRILFLKLLESQLIRWNNDTSMAFLNMDKVKDFDKLEMLFFDVLAQKPHDRAHREFDYIPYLNSSLFELQKVERDKLKISNLEDDCQLPYYSKTVLKDSRGNKKSGEVSMLHYLFEFLDAYDFSSEGTEEVVKQSKSLINASVLGLIFEKLNGYKDGSFYTPGFITMYMSKETIEKAVIDKFNEKKGWDCQTIDELYDKIDNKDEANEIIDSLTICDPAVGSGHFLVSVLNTILRIKSELRILKDENGKTLRDYTFTVENDELIVKDDDGEIFDYRRGSREGTRIQKLIFLQKQKIIENSLFGVDINPNSVQITRLRLWIELLKHSYYDSNGSLVTMPNIDINIKTGNSLISRYDLHGEIDIPNIKHAIEEYKKHVKEYKEGDFLTTKKEIRTVIDDLKSKFGLTLKAKWKQTEKLKKLLKQYVMEFGYEELSNDLALKAIEYKFLQHGTLFSDDKITKAKEKEKVDLIKALKKVSKEIEEIEKGEIYQDAFEWRFEFPEVLDDEGNFVGFDVVIGNPPYGVKPNKEIKKYYLDQYFSIDDIYTLFIERGLNISSNNGIVGYITPIFWLTGDNFIRTRNFILKNLSFSRGIILPYDIFEDAYVDTGIFSFSKSPNEIFHCYEFKPRDKVDYAVLNTIQFNSISSRECIVADEKKIIFNPFARILVGKLSQHKVTIGDITISTRGILANESYFHRTPLTPSDLKVFIGKLDRYELLYDFKYISDEDDIKEKPSDFSIFTDERILIRRIVSRQFRIMASITNDNFINKKDIYIFKSISDNFSNQYILSIINSQLISYFKINISNSAKKDDFSQLTLSDIRNINIPHISKKLQEPFIEIVNRIIALKNQNEDTADLEERIDKMVYKLYNLSDDEIAVVRGSSNENGDI